MHNSDKSLKESQHQNNISTVQFVTENVHEEQWEINLASPWV